MKRKRWVLVANGLARIRRSLFRLLFLYDKNFRIFEKTKSKIKYPDCDSVIKPVPHSNKYPIPEPPSVLTAFDSESEASTNTGTTSGPENF